MRGSVTSSRWPFHPVPSFELLTRVGLLVCAFMALWGLVGLTGPSLSVDDAQEAAELAVLGFAAEGRL